MAFNLATFKTRSLTAVIFVIVMVAGVVLNKWGFFILFSIIHFGCWIEYQKLVSLIDKEYAFISPVHRYGAMIAGWCLMLSFIDELDIQKWWALVIFGVAVIIDLLKRPKTIAHSIFGLVYISLSCAFIVNLYGYASIPWFVPAFIIACMWINDTMAYIVGSLIGKTPFSKISPKKTWEGTIGGTILCIAVAGFLASKVDAARIPAHHWYIMAGIASIAGTVGDLLESKLKRLAGVKDSGHIMPGHGGFLDRFDSLLVATPFVWLYLQLAL
jgi:phosphatidate cytidylyltransferase